MRKASSPRLGTSVPIDFDEEDISIIDKFNKDPFIDVSEELVLDTSEEIEGAQALPVDRSEQEVNQTCDQDLHFLENLSSKYKVGKRADKTKLKDSELFERLKKFCTEKASRPQNVTVKDANGIMVPLGPSDKHALAWILWREQQTPSGGIITDDLNIVLRMLSLIINRKDNKRKSDDDTQYPKGDTLVVCSNGPTSFEWEDKMIDLLAPNVCTVRVHQGPHRDMCHKRLAKINVIITTYDNLIYEEKNNRALFKINWKRIILDDAHIIRNHNNQISKAIYKLMANARWALTSTPIQNKTSDLFGLVKFLKCSPLDDIRVWNRWIDNDADSNKILQILKSSLIFRRESLMDKEPKKFIENVMVQLDHQEQCLYKKIFDYSRTLFAQFADQREENANFYGIELHKIWTLLLRLRQFCCHPALIHTMLEDDVKQSGIMENVDIDLLSRVNNMSLNEIDNPEKDIDINQGITENLFTAKNPVFDHDRISSKMKMLLNVVKEILQKGDDKVIIVSQWSSLLEVIASHLSSIEGATFDKFTGKVSIKHRQRIIESFNNKEYSFRILLLSLTARGVELNFVCANHLLFFDIYWNPQLETQLIDRIYRFGQTKNVYIYKFICVNTIEEHIKALQERKFDIARNVLSGDGSNAATKLTLNDLKSLFGF